MNINDRFESKFLKASDLQGRSIKVKIREVSEETIGQEVKIVLYFAGKTKGMIANRTNCMTCAEMWGPETDNWIGGDVELFSMKVPFQGKLTDGLRLKPLPKAPAAVTMAPNARDRANTPVFGSDDEEAPF